MVQMKDNGFLIQYYENPNNSLLSTHCIIRAFLYHKRESFLITEPILLSCHLLWNSVSLDKFHSCLTNLVVMYKYLSTMSISTR